MAEENLARLTAVQACALIAAFLARVKKIAGNVIVATGRQMLTTVLMTTPRMQTPLLPPAEVLIAGPFMLAILTFLQHRHSYIYCFPSHSVRVLSYF